MWECVSTKCECVTQLKWAVHVACGRSLDWWRWTVHVACYESGNVNMWGVLATGNEQCMWHAM